MLTIMLTCLALVAEAAVPYKPPYLVETVAGDVKAVYFDGSRLWSVYVTPDGYTVLSLYTVENGVLKPEWTVKLEGSAVDVATTSDMSLIAVALDTKKVYVYDVSGTPVFKVERGIRGVPVEVGLASRSGGRPDTLIIVDKWGDNYWVYAYAIDKPGYNRGELWLNALTQNVVNVTISETNFGVDIVHDAASLQAEPVVAVAILKQYNVTYRIGNETIVPSRLPQYPSILLLRVAESGAALTFNLETREPSVIKLGYEIGREPFTVNKLLYFRVYRVSGGGLLALLGVDVSQIYVQNVTVYRVPRTTGLVIADVSRGESLVRYIDNAVGTLDFYPMGTPTASRVSVDGSLVVIGADDYNVYAFWRNAGLYYARYSLSLGSKVVSLAMDPFGFIILAGGEKGMVYAFRGGDGMVYWRYPGPAGNPVVDVRAGYAAMGFANAPDNLIAFLDPRRNLRYVRVRLYIPPDYEKPYILNAPVLVNITSDAVYYTVNKTTSEMVSTGFVILLPVGLYRIHVDHLILGVADYAVDLTSDADIYIPVDALTPPLYTLRICVLDSFTGKPAMIKLNVTRAPWPEEPLNETRESYLVTTGSDGCASLTLRRAYWSITLGPSWRYSTLRLVNATLPVRLWGNVSILALAEPYIASIRVVARYMSSTTPVQNATVVLRGVYSSLVFQGLTDAQGVFEIPKAEYDVYLVTVRAQHFETYTTRVVVNNTRQAVIEVQLRPLEYLVTLIPVDAETGAPLDIFTYKLVRREDGALITGTVTRGYIVLRLQYGTYTLTVSSPGYQSVTTTIVADRDRMLRLVLSPIYYTVVFEVVDAIYQRPLKAKLVVKSLTTGKTYEAIVYGTGSMMLRTGVYTVTAYSPYAYKAKMRFSVVGETKVRIELLPRNFTITFIPLDAELRKPLTTLGVTPRGYVYCEDTGVNKTLVPLNGRLVATLPYSTRCVVLVAAPGYRTAIQRLEVDANKTVMISLDPVLYTLIVRAASKLGVEITEFNLTVRGGPLNETIRLSVKGAARLLLRPGVYTVSVSARYHMPLTQRIVVNESMVETKLVLTPVRYTVTLRVVDSETGMAVRKAKAIVERMWPARTQFVVSLPGGLASIPLTFGKYRVTIEAPGYREKSVEMEVPLQTSLVVPLRPLRFTLKVTVVESLTNKPIPNATVLVFGEATGASLRAMTDKKGVVELRLRSDNYRLVVLAKHYRGFETRVPLYSDTSIDAKLKPYNYTLTLLLYDGFTGKPVKAKGWVFVKRVEGGVSLNVTLTKPSVTLTLPYGTYNIRIGVEDYKVRSLKITLANNTEKRVYLDRVEVSATVKVIDTRGAPVQNAIVRFISLETGQLIFVGVTGKDGTLTAPIPWGTYDIDVEAGGYYKKTTVAEIRPGTGTIPIMIRPTLFKVVMDLLPAMLIAGSVVGSAVWIGLRVKRRPVGAEILAEEIS